MIPLIGRALEKELFLETIHSDRPEILVVYGRRRVGKTFLVRNVCEPYLAFSMTGLHHGTLEDQLKNFSDCFSKSLGMSVPVAVPSGWMEAFAVLKEYLAPLLKKKPRVLFIDEFPWLDTPRSGFMTAFENFWNAWGSQQPNLKVVLCGSAASWMIKNVINNKGGLHNRITRRIRLMPFTLSETELFLRSKKIVLDRYQIAQLYMVTGGIPHYLNEVKPGFSAAQNIDRMCFMKDGLLKEEFKILYTSLFDQADRHVAIVKALADHPMGLSRNELMAKSHLSSGGTATQLLDELLESGFISAFIPFQKKSKDAVYKLADEYSAFYLKYIRNARTSGEGSWLKISTSPSWKSWSGLAFESMCMKHLPQIKKALGIAGVYCEESIWKVRGNEDQAGAQIDLLIDRADHCISVCEMKFSATEFSIDKKYAAELQQKVRLFREQTKTKKAILGVVVSTFGLKNNEYKSQWVQNEVRLEDLF